MKDKWKKTFDHIMAEAASGDIKVCFLRHLLVVVHIASPYQERMSQYKGMKQVSDIVCNWLKNIVCVCTW